MTRSTLTPHRKPAHAAVPAEPHSCMGLGMLVHLGPAIAFVTLLSVFGRSVDNVLYFFFVLSLGNLAIVLSAERFGPSVRLDDPSVDDATTGLALVFLKGVAAGGAVVLGGRFLLGVGIPASGTTGWGTIALAVLATDAVYYCTHRWLNHSRGRHPVLGWFRRKHALHHSVTELDFLRGNVSSFFDTAVTGFQVPLAIVATVLGLDLPATLTAYGLVLMLQATHHVNHTFHIGPLRYLFMDNHAHKLHHCPGGFQVNHGALFSLWDLLGGTYFEDWSLSSNHMHQNRVGLPVKLRRAA